MPGDSTITAAIPCYNGAAYVGRAIESLLAQTRPADEILVVDDGSSDETADIVRRYPVVLIQHGRNRGLAAARNTALAKARGEILVFTDADTFADPDCLGELLSGYADLQVAGVGGQGIEANIHSLADRWRRAHASQSHGEVPKDVPFLYGLCMSFRRPVLEQIGGFDPGFRTNGEDMDIGLRLGAGGFRLRYAPGAKVYHQRTDDLASLQRTITAWYVGAYRARRINHGQPWRLFAGTLRRIWADPLQDLLAERDPELAKLSWHMGWLKLRTLWRAARKTGTEENNQ